MSIRPFHTATVKRDLLNEYRVKCLKLGDSFYHCGQKFIKTDVKDLALNARTGVVTKFDPDQKVSKEPKERKFYTVDRFGLFLYKELVYCKISDFEACRPCESVAVKFNPSDDVIVPRYTHFEIRL